MTQERESVERVLVAPMSGVDDTAYRWNVFQTRCRIVRKKVERLTGEISRFEVIDALTDEECTALGGTREELRVYSPENIIEAILCRLQRDREALGILKFLGPAGEKKDYRTVYVRQ